MQPSNTINTQKQVVYFPSNTAAFLYLDTSKVVSDGQSTIWFLNAPLTQRDVLH